MRSLALALLLAGCPAATPPADGGGDLAPPDAAAAGSAAEVRLGKGDGSFKPKLALAAGGQVVGPPAAGAFVAAGHADVVVTVQAGGRLVRFPGNGDGTFGAPQSIPLGNNSDCSYAV